MLSIGDLICFHSGAFWKRLNITVWIHIRAMKKGPLRCLGLYTGDYYYPVMLGITINQYKDPYETTSIMESKRDFFVAQKGYKDHTECAFHLKILRKHGKMESRIEELDSQTRNMKHCRSNWPTCDS